MRKKIFLALLIIFVFALIVLLRQIAPEDFAQRTEGFGLRLESIEMFIEDGGRLDWSHANGLVAFDRMEENGFFALHTITEDASERRCITCGNLVFDGRHVGQPSWHPSGEWILFQAEKRPNPDVSSVPARPGFGRNNDIWVMRKDGSAAMMVYETPPGSALLHPYFSREGSMMVWAEKDPAPRPPGIEIEENWMLKLADVEFDGAHFSLTNIREIGPKRAFYESHGFTSDDSSILFTANLEEGQEVWGMDVYAYELATGAITNLTQGSMEWDEHGKISPDGRHIAWMSSRGCRCDPSRLGNLRTDMWIMNSDGSDKRRLTYFSRFGAPERQGRKVIAGDSAWSPDGTRLLVRLIVDRTVGELLGTVQERNPLIMLTFERDI